MTSAVKTNPGIQPPRVEPKGGYEPISVAQLAMVWWAYQAGRIDKLGLRAYFGCIELEVRRRLSRGRYQPSLVELRRLVGGKFGEDGQGRLRPAVNSLLKLGLFRFCSRDGVSFAQSPDELILGVSLAQSPDELILNSRSGLDAMLAQLQGVTRKVPVPRRMIRRLAGGLSKARTATVIAHLIRCLFYRKSEGVNPVGCCKASWVAKVFGVTERSVFDARRFLVEELGWLLPRDCTQRVLNRDGLWVGVNLDWGSDEQDQDAEPSPIADEKPAAAAAEPRNDSSGPRPENQRQFSGPSDIQNQKPLAGAKNQKPTSRPPASGGPAGVSISQSDSKSEPTGPNPTLGNIVPEDFRQTSRLLVLHAEAVKRGYLTNSEANRLKFLAGAEHAQAVGDKPCRLFAWMIRGRRWEYITQADEDAACARLRKLRAIPREAAPARPVAMQGPPPLSKDALFVREVSAIISQKGYRGDPFPVLRREKPEWTRERWDRAVAEINDSVRAARLKTVVSGIDSALDRLGACGAAFSGFTMSSVGE